MKKYCKLLFIVIVSMFLFDVHAADYSPYDIIPITSNNNNIMTNTFNYMGVTYNSALDETGSPYFTFGGIYNNTKKKIPVTIAIGLFDKDNKNIGTIFYCTKRDYDSKYSGLEVKANGSVYFKISAKSKYFVEGKGFADVTSYSILNDNKDCEAAGFSKYAGLTPDEIKNGVKPTEPVVEKPIHKGGLMDIIKTISGGLQVGLLFLGIIAGLFFYMLYCQVLNNLYKRMYNTASSLVFVPIVNFYLCVKLAFGPVIGLVWIGLLVLGGLLAVLKISFLLVIAELLLDIAFIACIIKLITKKYALFYYDPNVQKGNNKNNDKKKGLISKFIVGDVTGEDVDLNSNNVTTNIDAIKQGLLKGEEESLIDDTGADSFKVDLNYSAADVANVNNDYFDVSSGFSDTGAAQVDTTGDNKDSATSDIVSFMGTEVDDRKTGGTETTDFSSILNLDDEEEKEADFDEDLPGDE